MLSKCTVTPQIFLTNHATLSITSSFPYPRLCEASHNMGQMQFYLAALNDTKKLPDENPSIGIIICKGKSRTIVEYALKTADVPIGVATYSMHNTLPDNLKDLLPDPDEIASRLEVLEELP